MLGMSSNAKTNSSDSSASSSQTDDSSTSSTEMAITVCTVLLNICEWEAKYHCIQISWETHSTILVHEKQLAAKRRMPYHSFMALLKMIEPKLLQSDTMSILSCGQLPVCPGHILGLTIRWLSGGSYHDIRDAGNFSKPTFFRLLWLGLNSINSCNEVKIKLPQTEKELDEVRDDFTMKSTEGVMSGCVGALDGFLFLIRTPRGSDAANSRQYFSGHYSRMGLNV
jgi:hypothetical protein